MGAKQHAENRSVPRQPVKGFLPGRWTALPSGANHKGRLVDVSSQGIGIRLSEQLLPDTMLVWEIGDQKVAFEVRWGLIDPDEAMPYRYGLVLQTDHDIVALLGEVTD